VGVEGGGVTFKTSLWLPFQVPVSSRLYGRGGERYREEECHHIIGGLGSDPIPAPGFVSRFLAAANGMQAVRKV
jgi:hypothetical protein